MRFRVPQFIDIEDKIFGPFTFKQFAYMAGGAGIAYVLYRTLPFYLAVIFIVPVISLAAALTFIRVNEKPFINIMQAFLTYMTQTKLYVWQKKTGKKEAKKVEEIKKPEITYAPRLTEGKLKDISWSLDVLDMKRK